MDTVIAAPASCEVRAVISFLHAEGQSAAEIHRRLCRVYGDNVNKNRSSLLLLSVRFDAMTTRSFLQTNRRLILE